MPLTLPISHAILNLFHCNDLTRFPFSASNGVISSCGFALYRQQSRFVSVTKSRGTLAHFLFGKNYLKEAGEYNNAIGEE